MDLALCVCSYHTIRMVVEYLEISAMFSPREFGTSSGGVTSHKNHNENDPLAGVG